MLGQQVRCCPPACLRPTERPNVWLVQGRVAGQAGPAGAGWYTPHWYRGWDWLRMCGVCCCLHCLAAAWAGGCWLENWKPINTPSPQRSSQPPPPPLPLLTSVLVSQWSPWLPGPGVSVWLLRNSLCFVVVQCPSPGRAASYTDPPHSLLHSSFKHTTNSTAAAPQCEQSTVNISPFLNLGSRY